MSEIFQKICLLRTRDTSDISQVISLVSYALSAILALKPKSTPIAFLDRKYILWECLIASDLRITRPCRQDFIDFEVSPFEINARTAFEGSWSPSLAPNLERFVYTAQQIIGCYLDLFHPKAARRVVGTVFEALIACALNRVCGLSVGSGTVRIPNSKVLISTDLGVMRDNRVVLLVATKTSTRERLSQPFVQKLLVARTLNHPPKYILVVIGDVQRVSDIGVQHTFTAGQFQLYWEHLTPMDGVYYIDVPPQAEKKEFGGRIKRLKDLFDSDLSRLVSEGGE